MSTNILNQIMELYSLGSGRGSRRKVRVYRRNLYKLFIWVLSKVQKVRWTLSWSAYLPEFRHFYNGDLGVTIKIQILECLFWRWPWKMQPIKRLSSTTNINHHEKNVSLETMKRNPHFPGKAKCKVFSTQKSNTRCFLKIKFLNNVVEKVVF